MSNNAPLSRAERLEIVDVLRKGTFSHREIARQFKRSQSTISKVARDSGITPTHRRMRSPVATDLESTFTSEERINLTDRVLGVIGALVEGGGLNPRELRETTQALKQTLDARRAEDIAPEEESVRETTSTDSANAGLESINLEVMFNTLDQLQSEYDAEADDLSEYGSPNPGYLGMDPE